jgi:hypothetical protein
MAETTLSIRERELFSDASKVKAVSKLKDANGDVWTATLVGGVGERGREAFDKAAHDKGAKIGMKDGETGITYSGEFSGPKASRMVRDILRMSQRETTAEEKTETVNRILPHLAPSDSSDPVPEVAKNGKPARNGK